jgi:hypothetical protein
LHAVSGAIIPTTPSRPISAVPTFWTVEPPLSFSARFGAFRAVAAAAKNATYVAVLAKGDSQEKAFGYAYAVIAAAALKAGLINAGEVGMGKAPFFVWGAIASYIAYKALDE